MSVEFILAQLVSIQDRLSQASSLNGEETQRLTGIFQQIKTCSLYFIDRAVILSLQGRVTQSPQAEDLQKIFLLLLKNSSDETIAHFLGLNTWQSSGNVNRAKLSIIECVKTGNTVLNLCGDKLSSLPSGFSQLIHLEKLNLSLNQLTSLPVGIGQFRRMKDLRCERNLLTALPAEIGQLSQLEVLICDDNGLTTLPAEIGQLAKLQFLGCYDNKLVSLPSEIGQLGQLKTLSVSYNKLTTLPLEIGQLAQLETLSVDYNRLTALPAEISQLRALRELKCASNVLSALPAQIGQLSQLEVLICDDNGLTTLPAEIGQLGQLKTLSVNSNRLTALPAEISQLRALRQLDCAWNVLSALPAQIGQLTLMERLQCSHNRLSSIPVEIGQLTRLQKLNAIDNLLTSLPLTLSSLTQATLHFSENYIHTLPPELNHLNINLSNQRIVIRRSNPQQGTLRQGTSFGSLKEAVSDSRQDLKKLEIPKLQEDAQAWATISLWLDKLMGSADFKNANTCSMTAERVLSILKMAEENEEYRAAFNAVLTQALSTCIDRATLPLCSLEIQKAIIESKAGSIEQMLEVLKGAFASDLIDTFARQFVKSHSNPAVKREELEVYLGFQVKLKEEFNLPIGVQNVNYFFCSHIGDTDLVIAKTQVSEWMQDRKKFMECLCQQTAWTEKLVKEYSTDRDVFLEPLNAEFGRLDDQMLDGALNSQQYEIQANALKTRFEVAEKEWLKIKTEELCLNLLSAAHLFETVITVKCPDLPSDQSLFIRGSCAGLNWNQGVKLTPIDWETFQFKTNVPFTGELEYKFLINDDDSKWETGTNHKVSQGKTLERTHSFHTSLLPPIKKTVVQLEFSIPQGKTLFLCGTGPLGNWDRKVPMKLAGNNNDSWFFSFDGEFPTFEYKLLLDDKWEEGSNRKARCGSKTAMKAPTF